MVCNSNCLYIIAYHHINGNIYFHKKKTGPKPGYKGCDPFGNVKVAPVVM